MAPSPPKPPIKEKVPWLPSSSQARVECPHSSDVSGQAEPAPRLIWLYFLIRHPQCYSAAPLPLPFPGARPCCRDNGSAARSTAPEVCQRDKDGIPGSTHHCQVSPGLETHGKLAQRVEAQSGAATLGGPLPELKSCFLSPHPPQSNKATMSQASNHTPPTLSAQLPLRGY